jgi:hypothetical protein
MKKKSFFISLIAAMTIIVSINAHAQQIAVVTPQGATSIYTDLNLALQGAAAGSTIYLSGGGFQANDSVKINKRLTIIGIGHKPNNDNADGNTSVSGNLNFVAGSDNSAVMGIYLSENVSIGNADGAVNNFLLRYCNVNSINVGNSNCQSVLINQNYIRSCIIGGNSAISATNNIINIITNVKGGLIDHNIYNYTSHAQICNGTVTDSQIKNNIIKGYNYNASNCVFSNNMYDTNIMNNCGDNGIGISDWANEFIGPDNGINPSSDFHLKATSQGKQAGTDGTEIGIYGGSGFNPAQVPPGPRIVSKSIADKTDQNGQLNVNIEVKIGSSSGSGGGSW